MIFSAVLIYDYTEKVQFNYAFVATLLLFFLIGFLLIQASKMPDIRKLRPGLLTALRLMMMRGNPKKNKIYGRVAIGFCIFLAVIYTYNFLYIKKPGLYYDIASLTGRVEKIEVKTDKGSSQLILNIHNQKFILPKDKGLVSNDKLKAGDSVMLYYFIDDNRLLDDVEKKRIVRLELTESGK